MPSWNAPPGKGYSNFSGAPLTTDPSSASGNIFKALDGGLAGRDGIWNEFSATSFAHAGTEQFASRVGEFLGSSAEISAARLTSKIAPASQNINDSLRAHVYLPAEPPAPRDLGRNGRPNGLADLGPEISADMPITRADSYGPPPPPPDSPFTFAPDGASGPLATVGPGANLPFAPKGIDASGVLDAPKAITFIQPSSLKQSSIDGDIAKTTASQLPNGEQHQPLLSGSADTGPSAAKIENYSSRRVGPPSFANPPKAKAPPAVPAVLADVSSMAPPPAIPQVTKPTEKATRKAPLARPPPPPGPKAKAAAATSSPPLDMPSLPPPS